MVKKKKAPTGTLDDILKPNLLAAPGARTPKEIVLRVELTNAADWIESQVAKLKRVNHDEARNIIISGVGKVKELRKIVSES